VVGRLTIDQMLFDVEHAKWPKHVKKIKINFSRENHYYSEDSFKIEKTIARKDYLDFVLEKRKVFRSHFLVSYHN
jgi:hypothetical protein